MYGFMISKMGELVHLGSKPDFIEKSVIMVCLRG
jgi:hypothetical protein